MNKKQVSKRKKATSQYYNNVLNERIRTQLEENDMSTQQLATKLQVSSEAVRLWTSGYARPDIDKITQIAKIFYVSTDYLLGNTDRKRLDYDERLMKEEYGIYDDSMKKLLMLTKNKNHYNNEFKLILINYIIKDNLFMNMVIPNLLSYYKARDNGEIINDEIKKEYDISKIDLTRYSTIKAFEEFIDSSYMNLWYKESSTLIDMAKQKKSKKKEK